MMTCAEMFWSESMALSLVYRLARARRPSKAGLVRLVSGGDLRAKDYG